MNLQSLCRTVRYKGWVWWWYRWGQAKCPLYGIVRYLHFRECFCVSLWRCLFGPSEVSALSYMIMFQGCPQGGVPLYCNFWQVKNFVKITKLKIPQFRLMHVSLVHVIYNSPKLLAISHMPSFRQTVSNHATPTFGIFCMLLLMSRKSTKINKHGWSN